MPPDLQKLNDSLLAEIQKIPLVDTHCHLEETDNLFRVDNKGFGLLLHYIGCDLVSVAQSQEHRAIADADHVAPDKRWSALEPYWEHLQFGSYMDVLNRGLKALYGVNGLSRENCAEIEKRMRAFYHGNGYEVTLKQKANLEVCIIDPLEPAADGMSSSHRGLNCDPRYFLCDYHERVTEWGHSHHRLAAATGVRVHDLDSWMEALYTDLKKAAPYAPGIKCTLGYSRVLDFAATDEAAARAAAKKAIDGGWCLLPHEAKALVDYMIDRLALYAAEFNLPIKFHTGMHAGGWNWLERANPAPLTDLIRRHPQTRFDLFHISYPYFREAALLAKYYGNVTVNMCWAWAFSPSDSGQALNTFLDLVPTNKIFAFGADYFNLEGVAGHAEVTREGIARVLAQRVWERRVSESGALDIAQRIMHRSPMEHFRIAEKRRLLEQARAARKP